MTLRFKEPHVIRATYRIVTPMFIGDAQQKASGISPASVKGALRFWWRALNWGALRSSIPSDRASLEKLSTKENELFGSSAETGSAARFTLRVSQNGINIARKTDWPSGKQNDSSSYLGLGLWQMGNQAQREYIEEGQTFTVELRVQDDVDVHQLALLQDALKAWGLLGGLGSRARRAFGSISMESIDDTNYQFSEVEAYRQAVSELFNKYRISAVLPPPYSAISADTAFGISAKLEASPRQAHAMMGELFKNYRGQPSSLRGSKKRVFGLPYAGGTRAEGDARRASPLLMHIHPIANKYVKTALFLPSEFHHDSELQRVDFSLARGFLAVLPEVVIL